MLTNRAVQICVAGYAVVLLAGCSSSGSGKGSTAHPGGSTATSSKAPAALPELTKIVLHAADLPAGWKGTPYQADPNDAADQAEMVRCVGARSTAADKVAEANSEDFALGDASISSSATSYRTQSDVDVDVAIMHSPKVSTCINQLFTKQISSSLPSGAKILNESIKITPGSAGGPANVIATGKGTVTVNVSGQQGTIYLTVAFITGPLIEAEVDTENVGSPVPESLVQSLVTAVANRAAKG